MYAGDAGVCRAGYEVAGDDAAEAQWAANARLISEAPTMLEMIRRLYAAAEKGDRGSFEDRLVEFVEGADALLKRVEGP